MFKIATSNSFDFQLTRNDIIKRALQKVGVVEIGDTPSIEQYTAVAETLNTMIKSWQQNNIHIWKVEWRTHALTASSEVTGTDSNVYTCIKGHMSAAANKPVTGANYTDYWKLAGSTGGAWVTATAYSAIGNIALANNEVMGIEQAFWRSGYTDTPIWPITREEYFSISDKTIISTPTKIYLERTQNGLSNIYLWPQPATSTDILHCAEVIRLEDFDSASDNADFDVKWLRTIIWNLAYELAIGEYPVPAQRLVNIREMAVSLYSQSRADSNEDVGDIHIYPGR